MILIRIAPTGQAKCLYTEAIDLASIGKLKMRRASHVKFNAQQQRWEVKEITSTHTPTHPHTHSPIFAHPSRQACLNWERQHFNSQL